MSSDMMPEVICKVRLCLAKEEGITVYKLINIPVALLSLELWVLTIAEEDIHKNA